MGVASFRWPVGIKKKSGARVASQNILREWKKRKALTTPEIGEASAFSFNRALSLSDQGSNLDFLESKSSVLPVTPSDNFPVSYALVGTANVLLEKFEASLLIKIF